jgi:hypothetical protein
VPIWHRDGRQRSVASIVRADSRWAGHLGRLTAELHGPRLMAADGSRWKPAAPDRGDRGRGLAMTRALMTDVVIEPTAFGTTVRMSRDVR